MARLMSFNSPNAANPFETLKLPVVFDLDEKQLHRQMIELAAANHPDRFEDPLDQADAAERAAAINQAYRQLKNPASRAQAMLSLLADTGERDEKALPPNLLMEMMDIREEMEDAITAKDTDALYKLRIWAREQEADYLASLSTQLMAANDSNAGDAQKRQGFIQQAQVSLNALRYMTRMLEQMPAEADA